MYIFKYFIKIYLFNKTNDEILSFSQVYKRNTIKYTLLENIISLLIRTSNVYSSINIPEKCISFDLSMKAFHVARFHSKIVSQIYLDLSIVGVITVIFQQF